MFKDEVEKIGVVIIGLNEEANLANCIDSVCSYSDRVVYVDSGSIDSSLDIAKNKKINIIELDLMKPLSAGRARNEGFYYLTNKFPDLEYVQFLDGDSELSFNWLTSAMPFFKSDKQIAIVVGRVTEKNHDQSIYKQIIKYEWQQLTEDSTACGGIFFCRARAFSEIQGFDLRFYAGEEADLCARLRKMNWKIQKVENDMCVHNLNNMNFFGLLHRIKRGGYAFGIGYLINRSRGVNFQVREVLRILFWGLFMPILLLFGLFVDLKISIIVFFVMLFQVFRIVPRLGDGSFYSKFLYSAMVVFGKSIEMIGFVNAVVLHFGKREVEYQYRKN